MRVENIRTKFFNEVLEIVGNVIPIKTSINALTNIYINVEENKITLTGSNNEISIKKEITTENFNIIENGNCLVDYKLLKAIFSKLNGELSNFYIKDNNFIIENKKSVFKLNLVDIKQYPIIKFDELKNNFVIKNDELKNIIKKTTFACSNLQTRPILTGVNFNINKDNAYCIATDSFRLSKYEFNIENISCKEEVNFTIPKNSLIALEKIISKTNEEYIKVSFDTTNNSVLINTLDTTFKTILLEGNYPNINNIINFIAKGVLRVNKNDLINALNKISVFSDENGVSIANIKINEKEMTIETVNTQIGNGKELLQCNSDIELELNCQCDMLIEALKSFNDDIVLVKLRESVMPFIINSENETKLIQLVLPLRRV